LEPRTLLHVIGFNAELLDKNVAHLADGLGSLQSVSLLRHRVPLRTLSVTLV
jgi:hypothetical protein